MDAFEAAERLALPQHGLAEQVEVEAGAGFAEGRERRTELVGARVDDEVPDHLAQHTARDRHGRCGQHGGDGASGADGGAQVPRQEARHERGDPLQVGCRGGERLGAHDAVDEADREGQPVRVLQHARKSLGGRVDRHVGGFGDPALGESDRLGDESIGGIVRHGVLLGHVSRLHRLHRIRMRHDYDSTKAMISDRYRS